MQSMAAARDPKRPKPRRPPAPPGHKHLPDAHVPRVVTAAGILGVVHSGIGPDRVVAWVAARQLGLITAEQLTAAGVGRGSVRWRLANGALHRVFRGVYLVGHSVPAPGAVEFAALLACGTGALISHRSAAGLWGIAAPASGSVELTVVGRDCRSRDGLQVHQIQTLDPRDRTTRRGIPVTAPGRTAIDYAATTSYEEAERAIAEAFALRLLSEAQLKAACDRAPHRAGVALVRAILGQPTGPRRTRSGGERAMLRLIRAAGLPEPLTNHPVEGFTADFFWPEVGLIVELDGGDFHRPRPAFERDHRRDVVHTDAGHEVLRVSGQQLDREPVYIAAVIVRAYERRSRGRG
jgi:very-short-patch-repair endonuclease